mmetsp:Transcript_22423/g.33433  ORF Transcript_22423/g.33433 Transcript_22423/m.33433 type:complete len:1013 (+) Transcript_22423:15-3053(+)
MFTYFFLPFLGFSGLFVAFPDSFSFSLRALEELAVGPRMSAPAGKKRKKTKQLKKPGNKKTKAGRRKSESWVVRLDVKYYMIQHQTRTWDVVYTTETKNKRVSKSVKAIHSLRYIEHKDCKIGQSKEKVKNLIALTERGDASREVLLRMDNMIESTEATSAYNNCVKGTYKDKRAYIKTLAVHLKKLEEEEKKVGTIDKTDEKVYEELGLKLDDTDEDADKDKLKKKEEKIYRDTMKSGLGVSLKSVKYYNKEEKQQLDELMSWCNSSFCGTTFLPTSALMSPAEEIAARGLDEGFVSEIAEGLATIPIINFLIHVVIRTTTEFWNNATSKKPRSVKEVQEMIKTNQLCKQNFPYEVIAGHHRSKALLQLHQKDTSDPLFKKVRCVIYLSTKMEDEESIGVYGDWENAMSHNVKKTTIFDLVKRYRIRFRREMKRNPNSNISSFMRKNQLHFQRVVLKMNIGKGRTSFRYIMKLSQWKDNNYEILRKFLNPPKVNKRPQWKGTDKLSWFTVVPNQAESTHTNLLVKIMRSHKSEKSYTVKDMIKELKHDRWSRFITAFITRMEKREDSNIEGWNDVVNKYKLPDTFPMSMITHLTEAFTTKMSELPKSVAERFLQLKTAHEASIIDLGNCTDVADLTNNVNVKIFMDAKSMRNKLFHDFVYGFIMFDVKAHAHYTNDTEADVMTEFLKSFFDSATSIAKASCTMIFRTNDVNSQYQAQSLFSSVDPIFHKEYVYTYNRSGSVKGNEILPTVDEYLIVRWGLNAQQDIGTTKAAHHHHDFFISTHQKTFTTQDKKKLIEERHPLFTDRLIRRYMSNDSRLGMIVGTSGCSDAVAMLRRKKNAHVLVVSDEIKDRVHTELLTEIGKKNRKLVMEHDFSVKNGHPLRKMLRTLVADVKDRYCDKDDDDNTIASSTSKETKAFTPVSNKTMRRTRSSPKVVNSSSVKSTPSVIMITCDVCNADIMPKEPQRKCVQCKNDYHSGCWRGFVDDGKHFCHKKCLERFKLIHDSSDANKE